MLDKAGIREAPSTRGDCVWRISKLIRRAKSLAEPAVCCTLPRTCSSQAPVLGDQSVAWESAPISGGLSATGGRNLPDPWSYRQWVPPSLTRGTLGHAEPFHSPTLPVRLPSWSPVQSARSTVWRWRCRSHPKPPPAQDPSATGSSARSGKFPQRGTCGTNSRSGWVRQVFQTRLPCRASLPDDGAVFEQSPSPARVS